MSMTDPIADMLTRIRNANMVKHQKVDIPSSNMKVSIANVLKQEGFIKNYKVSVINEIKRVSKPGGRVYVKSEDIPLVKSGLGIAILSTSKGIITDNVARKSGVGGELICTVW